jgi:hypothetical protein
MQKMHWAHNARTVMACCRAAARASSPIETPYRFEQSHILNQTGTLIDPFSASLMHKIRR